MKGNFLANPEFLCIRFLNLEVSLSLITAYFANGFKETHKNWNTKLFDELERIANLLLHMGKAFLIMEDFNAHIADNSFSPVAGVLKKPFDSKSNSKRLLTLFLARHRLS